MGPNICSAATGRLYSSSGKGQAPRAGSPAPGWERGGPHLDAPPKEALAQHAEGDTAAVQQAGLTPKKLVRGRVVDGVVPHVLLQRLEVVLQVVTHHQLAFQELQDLARKTCTLHVTQGTSGGSGAAWCHHGGLA